MDPKNEILIQNYPHILRKKTGLLFINFSQLFFGGVRFLTSFFGFLSFSQKQSDVP
jgi:hypothetical protein